MAQKPDGKAAKAERVTFTRPAAERIAKIVRRVEQGDRGAEPLVFERIGVSSPFALKLATFTGNWETGTYKTVTLSGSTQTASVYNWCNPATEGDALSTAENRYVIFGKVSGTNSAIEVQATRPGLQVGTFTGNWQTGTYKTVTLQGSTQTASVYNWCNPAIGGNAASSDQSRYVIFGKASGTNSAVEIQMRSTSTQCDATLVLGSFDLSSLPGFDAGVIQLLGHDKQDTASTCSGGLQWYSITTCSTAAA